MSVLSEPIGELIQTAVDQVTAQACRFGVAPPFGGFIKVEEDHQTIYGVVYEISSGSLDPGGRPVMRGHEDVRDARIYDENPDLKFVLRTEFSALMIGHAQGGAPRHFLPPQPPPLHWSVFTCTDSEIERLTDRLDYFRTLLAASHAPADALLAANIRLASKARQRDSSFTVRAGRELASLLKRDFPRLNAILRSLADSSS